MTSATSSSGGSPLVTVVMIFLNGEKYITEAIESVVAQTYQTWELILVDDGSTDSATAIARNFSERHPDRITYLEHPGHANRGMSASRNAGVLAGSGEFVSFLDADDIWLPERLDRFIEISQRFPEADMIYGPTLYWYSWAGPQIGVRSADQKRDILRTLDLPVEELIRPPIAMRQFLLSNGGCLPAICSLLIRRQAFNEVGGFNEAFRSLYEDQVFLSKIALSRPILVIDDVLDRYRQHPESCCHKSLETGEYHPQDYHPARGVYLDWLNGHMDCLGIKDPIIKRALRWQMLPYRSRVLMKALNQILQLNRLVKGTIRRNIPAPALRKIQQGLQWTREVERNWRIRRVSR